MRPLVAGRKTRLLSAGIFLLCLTIPNAYKTLMAYMRLNRLEHLQDKDVIACFEREYDRDGTDYMDVYIAVK